MRRRMCKRDNVNSFSDIGVSFNFWVRALILYYLSREKSYGYELINNIYTHFPELSYQAPGLMGNYYRILRMLELEGLIESQWDTSGNGPAKRVYSITPAGRENLNLLIKYIEKTKDFVEKFLNFVNGKEVK